MRELFPPTIKPRVPFGRSAFREAGVPGNSKRRKTAGGLICSLVMVSSSLLFACAGEKLELTVKARIDGQPAAQARVTVDNEEQGLTGADGIFSRTIKKKSGAEVTVLVTGEKPGYRIRPWETTFVVKPPTSGAPDTYTIEADLQAMRYVTITATARGVPIKDAVVSSHGRDAGRTDANGVFIYEYKDQPEAGLDLAITRSGYAVWRTTGPVEPGQRIEAALSRRVTVSITALVEEDGQLSGIPGVAVRINNDKAGKTDAKGVFTYDYAGEPGKQAALALSAPGYIPETWKTSIALEDDVSVQRYFYPAIPKPIRTGIYRFAGNTPNADLKDVLSQAELAVAAQLFRNPCFREVPSRTLQADMKLAKQGIEKIIAQGWRETALRKTVDMIILGSVATDEKGILIETRCYTSDGKLILSRITRAGSAGDLNSAAKEIANAVLEQFPFEGTLVSVDSGRCRINLGKTCCKIVKGADFTLLAPRLDEAGRVSGFRETGRLRVNKVDENGSWGEVEELKKDEKIAIGDRVVRRTGREGGEEGARNYFILSAKGGRPPDVAPLAGVNIYVDDEWIGTTGPDGKAEVPARINEDVALMLYRQGYQQVTERVKIEKTGDIREYTLGVNTAVFTVDSQPQAAAVSIDGEKIGRTPILDNRLVPLGFHTVKVAIGGDYRDWEEEVEFSSQEENLTGERKIILARDVLKIGERAEQKDDVDAAIREYTSAGKGHPDYSEARYRLAQIYLEEKHDYDSAIREFENVLALPENQSRVFRQYPMVFMNLGHAYYEKGNELARTDRGAAAQYLASAVQHLETAKQNTRFFPDVRSDEAVHDTYYYTALSYHRLYQLTGKNTFRNSARLAWREYFDVFPKKLEGNSAFEQMRESARKYQDQLGDR